MTSFNVDGGGLSKRPDFGDLPTDWRVVWCSDCLASLTYDTSNLPGEDSATGFEAWGWDIWNWMTEHRASHRTPAPSAEPWVAPS